ncbi:UNVERIFIED_CONTAM: hypothetical protein GTU68_036260 [Idotea baltica]|nr:hypothetical protein [Idotea baltica]
MPFLKKGSSLDESVESYSIIALGVEYKGTNYHGFQRQKLGVATVQSELELALKKVSGGENFSLICAGRTDAAVHASGQVVHFKTKVQRSERSWVMGSNSYLPADISVTWAKKMPDHFNARFCAYARRYRYVIYNDSIRPAHMADQVSWSYRTLDILKMRQAIPYFLGQHDFSAFRARHCQAKSPIKTIHHIHLLQYGHLIVLDIRANAFLHHMVRNIAGVLMAIGKGEYPIEWAKEVLDNKKRCTGGVTATPGGLYLIKVDYPEEFDLPKRYLGPHFLSGLPDVANKL